MYRSNVQTKPPAYLMHRLIPRVQLVWSYKRAALRRVVFDAFTTKMLIDIIHTGFQCLSRCVINNDDHNNDDNNNDNNNINNNNTYDNDYNLLLPFLLLLLLLLSLLL